MPGEEGLEDPLAGADPMGMMAPDADPMAQPTPAKTFGEANMTAGPRLAALNAEEEDPKKKRSKAF
jgi:hypothetical protein